MGLLSKIFRGSAKFADKKINDTKDAAKTILGVEHAKQNYQFTKDMLNELKYKEDTQSPKYKNYEEWKIKNSDITEETMRQVYNRNCKAACMFGFMVLVSLGLMINLFVSQSSSFHKILVFLPTLSFGAMMSALYLRYSLVAYQIKIRQFIGLREFLPIAITQGFPSFKLPKEWKK